MKLMTDPIDKFKLISNDYAYLTVGYLIYLHFIWDSVTQCLEWKYIYEGLSAIYPH